MTQIAEVHNHDSDEGLKASAKFFQVSCNQVYADLSKLSYDTSLRYIYMKNLWVTSTVNTLIFADSLFGKKISFEIISPVFIFSRSTPRC